MRIEVRAELRADALEEGRQLALAEGLELQEAAVLQEVREAEPMLALTQLSNYLTLKGSFSAVSKPNFASKYALESSRRDLQNALLCTVLVGSVWVKKYTKINIEKMKSGKS